MSSKLINSRYKKYDVPIWNANVYFCETTDLEELNKKFDFGFIKNDPDWRFSDYDAFVWHEKANEGGHNYFLVIKPGVKDSHIAHECVHLAGVILDHRGVITNARNDEPMAYLVQHLFEVIKAFATTNLTKKND